MSFWAKIASKNKYYIGILLMITSIFVTSVVIEIGYRVYLWAWKPLIVGTPDRYEFNPNSSGTINKIQVHIDQHGFRNKIDSHAWEKKKKVMFIGDSVGFGLGVEDNQTISHMLNVELSSTDLGFLNLCYPGLDTMHIRNSLYEKATTLGPWSLVIYMYHINDAKLSSFYSGPLTLEHALETGEVRWKYLFYKFFRWPFKVRNSINFIQRIRRQRNESWARYYYWCMSAYDEGSKKLEVEKKFIYDIVKWSRDNNAELLFAVCPAENQFTDGNTNPQDFIKKLSKEFNVSYIDFLPYFAEANKKERIFLPDDHAHLNPNGNKLVSNIINNWLISNGYVK